MKKLYILLLTAIVAGCGGGGSTPTVSISSTTPTPQAVVASCINPHTDTSYPASFKGKYNIPVVQDTLPINVDRSMGFKDYKPTLSSWWEAYKVPNGCKGEEYVKKLYSDSLDKMQTLGIEHVELYIGSQGWTVDPALDYWIAKPESFSHSYELIEYIAQEAKKRNIKLNLVWQFNIVDDRGNFLLQLGEKADIKLWAKILESHHRNIVEVAKMAEKFGVDRIAADWNAMNIGNFHDPAFRELYVQKMIVIIDDIRKVFKGKITWGQSISIWHDYRIIDKIDILNLSVIPKFTQSELVNFSSDLVKEKTLKEMYRLHQDFNCIWPSQNYCSLVRSGKQVPVIFQIAIQSTDIYLTNGWVEDGFCITGITTDGKKHDCIQTTYNTDFSVQAVTIDGVIRALKEQPYFNMQGINFHSSYWHTDTLKPSTGYIQTSQGLREDSEGFPNLSQSIRGKPAEIVVKQWFKKP
jgi:hypothetical protein